MSIFDKPKAGGFMDEIRCDEPSYLIWKWHPAGSVAGNNNRENAIRWGSSLRVKDGEVAVFVYRQSDGTMQDFIVGPFDKKIETSNFLCLQVSSVSLTPAAHRFRQKYTSSILQTLFRLNSVFRSLMYMIRDFSISAFR